MFTIDRHPDASGFDRLGSEWAALEGTLSPRTPFSGMVWHKTWWAHMQRTSGPQRDELALYTVRDPAGVLVAIAPMMETRRAGFGPWCASELQALGADPYITELRGLICQPSNVMAVMKALREHVSATHPHLSWITWSHVPWLAQTDNHSPPCERLARHYRWMRPLPAYNVPLADTWSAFEAGLSKRVRKKLRNCANLLRRNGVDARLVVVTDPSAVAAALRTFYALVAQRSEVRHGNPFTRPDLRAFLNDYAVQSASMGELRLFQLTVGDEVVAMRIGFALGGDLYLYHSGNLPAWDHYSIMTTLLAEIFKYAIQQQFKVVNLSTGTDRSKTRWGPRELMFVDAVEVMPGVVNAAVYGAYSRARVRREGASPVMPDRASGRLALPGYTVLANSNADD